MSSLQRMSPSQKRSPSQKMWFFWFCIPVLKITVHREISPQIDEVVLCGHRHYANIFPVSYWLLEIYGLGGPRAADTPNVCFRSQAMQNPVRSGHLLAALYPGCATPVPSIIFSARVCCFERRSTQRKSSSANSFSRRDSAAVPAPSLALRPRAHKKSVHILIPSIPLRLFSMQVSFPFYFIFNE